MRNLLVAVGAVLALGAGSAHATTVVDAQGDFLSGYNGPKTGDLDVLTFSVNYNPGTQMFGIGATFADVINPASPGFYVVGINTGTGPTHPFDAVGQPNVRFNQAFTIQKTGVGAITVPGLGPQSFTATINGNSFLALIPLSFLPTTGFAAEEYGFNLWPRQATGGLLALADFSPENATISTGTPEPSTWAIMLLGFGMAGTLLRRRRALAAQV